MTDLKLIETGNGGDLVLKGFDLAIVNGIENMPYLSNFGGDDWWGNVFLPNDKTIQFNSITEKTLYSTALTSGGRITIENAVKKDLSYLKDQFPNSDIVVSSSINNDTIYINILIDGLQAGYAWNPEKDTIYPI